MSSGNITNGGNNGNGADKVDWQCVTSPDLVEQVEDLLKVQIAKFDEQVCRRCNKLMKWAAEQEVQRKAEEEWKKAKEGAKRVAEEEAKRQAEEEAKRKAKEEAQKRAEFQAWWQAELERKVKEKAEAKAAAKVMGAQIVQNVVQGAKPNPKCQKMKVKCHFEVLVVMMKRLASGEKHKESEMSATMVMASPQGGKKHKRMKRAVANAVSTKEIKEVLGGFLVVGPLTWPDPVTQVLDQELVWLSSKMDRFSWEMKQMADQSDHKGKGRAWPEETKEEEKLDKGEEGTDSGSNEDAEGEDE
ncbi:hypothetical protein SCLCIDRAFT_28586 [Scleroderma citrinum Foug A]|uniref:Uncharacterized protein n=1 Tax=Scleroderma citrinum Foug A TaxID=1036808 RepID=A0A0C2ZZ63_9AGAM|nr:hypothetical protein SCLCIDRAFT_28586 [Scleroderma citrinum Foug A]